MTYIALLTIEDATLNREIRPAHLQYISDLYRAHKVRMAGPFTDGHGGLVIYEVETAEEARQLAESDPVVRSGARSLRLIEWAPLDLPLADMS